MTIQQVYRVFIWVSATSILLMGCSAPINRGIPACDPSTDKQSKAELKSRQKLVRNVNFHYLNRNFEALEMYFAAETRDKLREYIKSEIVPMDPAEFEEKATRITKSVFRKEKRMSENRWRLHYGYTDEKSIRSSYEVVCEDGKYRVAKATTGVVL